MKLLSIDNIPGQEIEALGMVKGAVVQTKHFGKDFMAGLKTLVGGEIAAYTEMLNEVDADAIVGIRYGSAQVMQGAAEVLAYGTAVKIVGPAKEGTVRL